MLRSLALAVPADGRSHVLRRYRAADLWSPDVRGVVRGSLQIGFGNSTRIIETRSRSHQLAIAVANMPHFPDDADLVKPNSPPADGPLPAKVRFSSESEELVWVVDQALRLAGAGTVAVLFRTRWAPAALRNSGATRLHRNLGNWPAGPGLFFGTYHAAKGLEFDTVFLPMLSHRRWNNPSDIDGNG